MSNTEKLKQFFEQLRGKGNPTAQDIRNAAAATGNIAEIIPEILSYAAGMGIDAAAELADLTQARETANEENATREAAASLAEKSGALVTETDPEKRRELLKGIRKDVVSLEPSNGGTFQFVRIDSLKVQPPTWLVKRLIETNSFGCLYGDPGTGKSFIGIELSSCVVTGTPFYGLPVKKGPVIYLAGEGQSGLARRLRAWSIMRDVSLEGAAFYTNSKPLSLIDNNSMVNVVQALERLVMEIGRPPALAILDTWSRVLGGDDSAPSDAAAGVAALDDIRARFGNFAALIIHHEGHTKGRGRGWSGLRAAVDVEFRAELGNDKVLRLECTKSKDTEPMEPMAFTFAGVELEIRNESGEPVTSAVLNRVEWKPATKTGRAPIMGKNQVIALDILKGLDSSGPVSMEVWRKACNSDGINKQRFYDAKKSLIEAGIIEIDNNSFVRLVRNGNAVTPSKDGVLRTVTDIADKVTENNKTLPTVTVTRKTLPHRRIKHE